MYFFQDSKSLLHMYMCSKKSKIKRNENGRNIKKVSTNAWHGSERFIINF